MVNQTSIEGLLEKLYLAKTSDDCFDEANRLAEFVKDGGGVRGVTPDSMYVKHVFKRC